ncbi:hypothetical protein BJX70DRAFT_278538 [Aspergillus crustosus]
MNSCERIFLFFFYALVLLVCFGENSTCILPCLLYSPFPCSLTHATLNTFDIPHRLFVLHPFWSSQPILMYTSSSSFSCASACPDAILKHDIPANKGLHIWILNPDCGLVVNGRCSGVVWAALAQEVISLKGSLPW